MKRRYTPEIKIKTLAVNSAAVLITGGLFLTMTGLVSSEAMPDIGPTRVGYKDVIYKPVNIPPEKIKIKVDIPPDLIDPPKVDPDPRPKKTSGEPGWNTIAPDKPSTPETRNLINLAQTDGDMMILAGFPPQYPRRQLENGTEGYVVISLTVNADGQVKDPYVIDAEPSGVFNKPALEAISKFRYKPRVINGQAYPVFNVRYKMVFALEK